MHGSVITGPDTYDWTSLNAILDDVDSLVHQAILRPYYPYPGSETSVPDCR
ncbi:MAG: hypothetical protein GY822_04995 [Deltaproteobacteria bacterium]|nr:hypothetical protein [Deltaproteobacteria bacterium]